MKTPKLTWKTLINLSFLFLIIVFSLVLAIGLNAYVRSYNLLDAEKTRATVLAKTAEKGLFRPPAYYVKVDWNEKSGDLHEGVLNRISSRQMKNIEVGNEISGYLVSENHFITLLDLATDGLLLFFFLVFLFLMVIALVSAWVGNMFSAAKKQNKKSGKGRRARKNRRNDVKTKKNVSASDFICLSSFSSSLDFFRSRPYGMECKKSLLSERWRRKRSSWINMRKGNGRQLIISIHFIN